MQDIVSILKAIIFPKQDDTNFNNIVNEEGNVSLEKSKSTLKSSEESIDVNKSLAICSDISVSNNIESESNTSL
jgi:hypothetical protein